MYAKLIREELGEGKYERLTKSETAKCHKQLLRIIIEFIFHNIWNGIVECMENWRESCVAA